jgi:DNA polymerase-1
MSKLVLIDGNAIMHRSYHALPPLTTKEGEPINAVYGLVSMLLKIIQDLKPTHLAVCFDRKEPTFRKKAFREYQAHRPEMDEKLGSQFEKAKEALRAFNIPVFDKVGFEADDLIGTLANKEQGKIDEVVIVTGDKDILQLVNGKVKVYMPIKGLSVSQMYGKKEVEEKLNVEPKQIIDYKALVGDPSDNYPGVKGVGPKTAEKLLEKYRDLDNVYKNLDKIDASVRKKLVKDKKNAYLSRKLAKIVTDVSFKYDIKEAARWKVDGEEVLDLFKNFGFKTLTGRVKAVGREIESEKQGSLFDV